ncbi:MAG: hypothetical protein RL095_1270 [Verrucomicrobiota bacterium]|jgi:acyl-CoA thioesterase-1
MRFIVLALLFLSACRPEEPLAAAGSAPAQLEDRRPRLVCLGDSLTAGFGLPEGESWPALLQKRLDARGYAFRVVNAGTSGATSAGGLRKVEWLCREPVHTLVLALGANDGLRGLDSAATRDNLVAIIRDFRKYSPQVRILLAGMEVPPSMGSDYAASFRRIYPDLAKSEGVELCPFLLKDVGGHAEFNLPDGIHPNARGQQRLLENLWPHLEGLVKNHN